MNPIGIFLRTFAAADLADALDALVAAGFSHAHFNLRCVGLDTVPAAVPPEVAALVRASCGARRVSLVGLSGTYNMIDPDETRRGLLAARCAALIRGCRTLGVDVVSLCTGTRDPADMWRPHPANAAAAAWRDLRAGLDLLLEAADEAGVILAVEPEPGNVVASAAAARRLLDEVRSPRLRVILDAANLVGAARADAGRILDEAFDLLADDVVQVHAKEIPPAAGGPGCRPGEGLLDWPLYFRRIVAGGFTGPVILHNLPEADAAAARTFVAAGLAAARQEHA